MSCDPQNTSVPLRNELTARFQAPLMKYFLRRLRNHDQAQDMTQEVLLRVLRVTAKRPIDHAESFVFRIAINLLRDRRREAARAGLPKFVPLDEAIASELEPGLMEDLSPERVLSGEDSFADTLRTLEELGERTRDIFILFKLENMKHKDIAALMGIGQSTVEKHVMRAVLHLAARYGHK